MGAGLYTRRYAANTAGRQVMTVHLFNELSVMKKYIRVFAPGTVANLGCGFDVMGLTLDGVGDLLEKSAT